MSRPSTNECPLWSKIRPTILTTTKVQTMHSGGPPPVGLHFGWTRLWHIIWWLVFFSRLVFLDDEPFLLVMLASQCYISYWAGQPYIPAKGQNGLFPSLWNTRMFKFMSLSLGVIFALLVLWAIQPAEADVPIRRHALMHPLRRPC